MCYHNTLKKKSADLVEYYQSPFEAEDLWQEMFHIVAFNFPSTPIVIEENKKREIILAKWGLIPSWIFDQEQADTIRLNNLNAKAETIFEKASFKNSIKNKRCLIPSTGFFEWQLFQKKKFPYFISLKNSALFSMGGIYNEWHNEKNDEKFHTYSIVTTEANLLMQDIHNTKKRMPFILSEADEMKWINTEISQTQIQQLIIPFAADKMQAHTVSKLVSNFATQNSNVEDVTKSFKYSEFQQGSLF